MLKPKLSHRTKENLSELSAHRVPDMGTPVPVSGKKWSSSTLGGHSFIDSPAGLPGLLGYDWNKQNIQPIFGRVPGWNQRLKKIQERPVEVWSEFHAMRRFNVRGWLRGLLVRYLRPCAQGLHFSLTMKLHIWLAVKELYISSSGAEHRPARGAVHRNPRRHLRKASVGYLRDTIFVTWAVCKTSVYPA